MNGMIKQQGMICQENRRCPYFKIGIIEPTFAPAVSVRDEEGFPS